MAAYDVRGKVALVTGAARGIGLEIGRSLHARGASVALVDLDAEATEAAAASIGSGRVIGLGADVTDWDAIGGAVDTTVERFGGLDICVANAGIAPDAATVRVMEPEVFERVLDVNLLGTWRTVRSALPQVVARRGQVVIVSSIYAFQNGVFVAPYAASKAAVEQFGRALRVELAPHGASATVVYFGFVATEMVKRGFEADPLAERYEELIPAFMRRRMPARDAGEVVARGIERRAARVTAPRFWAAWGALRGILGPAVDRRFARDRRFLELAREVDVEGRLTEVHRVDASR
ncbi:MAG: short-chain dehydrogenase/reductase [Gemmatimonadota bacterium]|nr:short-chain dehydrogenase/reductase [Gemmatimonadota bacterium]